MRVATGDDRCRLFFRLFSTAFDDFDFFDFSDDGSTKSPFGKKPTLILLIFPKKCIWPGASEKPFGPSGGVREGILGGPAGSRGHLGTVLGGLGAILERLFDQSNFGSIF